MIAWKSLQLLLLCAIPGGVVKRTGARSETKR